MPRKEADKVKAVASRDGCAFSVLLIIHLQGIMYVIILLVLLS